MEPYLQNVYDIIEENPGIDRQTLETRLFGPSMTAYKTLDVYLYRLRKYTRPLGYTIRGISNPEYPHGDERRYRGGRKPCVGWEVVKVAA
jgi:hypothetical protein